MILLDGTVGRLVPSLGPVGVIPANFAALGTSPSPLANDADLPADVNTQWLWALTAPLASGGTTDANDAGGYSFASAPDGSYSQGYRGLTMATGGAVVVYEATITTAVGGGVSTSGSSSVRTGRRRRSVPSRVPTTSNLVRKPAEDVVVPIKPETIFGMTAEEEADDEAAAIAAAHLLLS